MIVYGFFNGSNMFKHKKSKQYQNSLKLLLFYILYLI